MIDHNRKRIANLSKANAIKEKVIHLDQLELLPIFPCSELLIWMLPASNVTDHSYFDSVYLKIFTALSFLFWQTKDFCLLPIYCRLEFFLFFFFCFDVKKPSDLQYMDRQRNGSYMGSADTEFGLGL